LGGGAWGRLHLQRVVLTPCLGGHGSATGRKGGGGGGWCGDGVGVAMALRARRRRSGTRSARRWSPVSRRGALAFCDRSGDRARRSTARRGERVPSSRRGALAFCKRGTKEGVQLEETWMINKPRSARMFHQRKITVTEHKERTLRWRWRKSNQMHVEKFGVCVLALLCRGRAVLEFSGANAEQ
jgi:hypothetical protein